ncbi:MAG TPA: tetraacyldisaccharide 4'-kinase [Burkholderiaceae bacterium]|nr:tetraacyldisaccharide 4'-kinase [Burkholderiaceae bacterium]
MTAEPLRAALEQRLERSWYRPSGAADAALRLLLAPLARIVQRAARSRRARITRLPAHGPGAQRPPVIVVGNLVAGGTGKTPLLIALAQALRERGFTPGIIARGYRGGATAAGATLLVDSDTAAAAAGDEPVLLVQRTGCPVAVGRRRAAALALLVERHPECDVVLSDDGLQHVGLPRAVELAVFDSRGAGNGRCLPAGPLREPLEHVQQMDAVLLNDTATAPAEHPRTFRSQTVALEMIGLDGASRWPAGAFAAATAANAPVAAIAGIGAPQRFFDLLQTIGLAFDAHRLADHARIDPQWLARLPARWIVMTEKDAVKCRTFAAELRARCVALRIEARPEPALIDWLEETLRGPATA